MTTNSDLISNNITTEEKAANHWQNIGIIEGKQACGSFHVLQFLDNYPDLKQKYGTNYTAAIEYYLQKNGGYDEHLLGYTIGGGYNRYTLGNVSKGLYISGSLRMATSIDSLVWNNIEFINNWGHGRQLQNTVHNQSAQCFNPNGAGTYDDWQSNHTTSILLNVSTTNPNRFESYVLPAFWMLPGEYRSNCGYAVNTKNVSNYTMHKIISFMDNEKYDIIEYKISFYVPYDMTYIHFEAPTAYLTQPFQIFYGVNMTKNKNGDYDLIQYNVAYGSRNQSMNNIPVMIATNDSSAALGVVPKELPQFYGLYNFLNEKPDSNKCTKWNVIQEFHDVKGKTWFDFTVYFCVGTVEDVKNCMIEMFNRSN